VVGIFPNRNVNPHLVWALDAQYYLILRTAELFPLTWDAFHWTERIAYVVQAKGGEIKKVYLPDDFLERARIHFDRDSKVGIRAVIHHRGRPTRSPKIAWKGAVNRAGLAYKGIRLTTCAIWPPLLCSTREPISPPSAPNSAMLEPAPPQTSTLMSWPEPKKKRPRNSRLWTIFLRPLKTVSQC